MSGLLVGILLSTSLAGLFSNLFHWKVIYVVSGILMLILAYALKVDFHMLCESKWITDKIFCLMAELLKQEKRLLLRALTGAFAFAAVSILYSTIALLLTAAHHLPDLVIGMVSLVGIFGALSTQYIGRYADQRLYQTINLDRLWLVHPQLDLFLFWTNFSIQLHSWICRYPIGFSACPY